MSTKTTTNERIAAFVTGHGHETLWSYLRSKPRVSLVAIAAEIGDVSAFSLKQRLAEHCFETKELGGLIRDLLAREICDELPGGWSTRDDVSLSTPPLPAPYDELAKLTAARLKIVVRPPLGWRPESGEDPLIVHAFENAFDALDVDTQRVIVGGKRVLRPGELAWQRIEPFWSGVSFAGAPDDFLSDYRKLPAGLGVLIAAHWFQSEVRNGGLHQFFSNSTGVLAPEALEGLRALKMDACAEILTQALRFFGDQYPRARRTRIDALKKSAGKRRENWDPFFALDDRLFELFDTEAGGYDVAADRFCETLKPG